ncbi:hypothetical protein PF010_g51 [Phytophthora fragariae]|uniref:Uncharacterized protein n=1 Tax=Phytophthora fragariae TaxID=53985 RepID=A0A6G0M570_9STRA|nr:hypothetical protein PF010_g51 [Phytophthora fragariae]
MEVPQGFSRDEVDPSGQKNPCVHKPEHEGEVSPATAPNVPPGHREHLTPSKHTDHDPSNKPFVCNKPKCGCSGFDSPWVCNCDHAWSAHRQRRVEKRFDPLRLLQAQCLAPELNAVQRTDLAVSPLDLRPQLH